MPMVVVFIGNIVNILLNWILIHGGLFGIELGVVGCSLSTVIGCSVTPILLVAVRFEPELISPPPFRVEDDEVKTLYAPSYSITRLGTAPALLKGNPCEEAAYCITLKADRG